jgi:hypothetical protein
VLNPIDNKYGESNCEILYLSNERCVIVSVSLFMSMRDIFWPSYITSLPSGSELTHTQVPYAHTVVTANIHISTTTHLIQRNLSQLPITSCYIVNVNVTTHRKAPQEKAELRMLMMTVCVCVYFVSLTSLLNVCSALFTFSLLSSQCHPRKQYCLF